MRATQEMSLDSVLSCVPAPVPVMRMSPSTVEMLALEPVLPIVMPRPKEVDARPVPVKVMLPVPLA